MRTPLDKFIVKCIDCEDDIPATYVNESNSWACNQCGKLYEEDESGRVVNTSEVEYYRQLYIGMKIAGIFNTEEEFRGDKEQMGYERW